MFARAAVPSTETSTQTNAFCSKGKEKSLKVSPRHLAAKLGRHARGPGASPGRGWEGTLGRGPLPCLAAVETEAQ